MSDFVKAVNIMGGAETKDRFYKDEVVEIISSVISLMQRSDSTNAIRRLQDLREVVDNGSYSAKKLDDIMTVPKLDIDKMSIMSDPSVLTELQMFHLSRLYKDDYDHYIESDETEVRRSSADDILKRFPAPPMLYGVYYGAESCALFLECYEEYWNVCKGDPYTIAWVTDGSYVHIIQFVDCVFNVGLVLKYDVCHMLIHLLDCYSSSLGAVRAFDDRNQEIELELNDAKLYDVRIDSNYIMSIPNSVFKDIWSSMLRREYTDIKNVRNVMNVLKTVT